METSSRKTDYLAGALMVVIGAGAVYVCSHYRLGTLTSMGPGFFPILLGVLLILLGLAIALVGSAGAEESPLSALKHHASDRFDLRGWACIISAPIAFILLAEHLGFLAASFSSVFIAAVGDRTATLKGSILLATGMTIFALVLFVYILHVEIPIVRLS
jgi:hypothetical protein